MSLLFHSVLFHYILVIFDQRSKYGISVWESRHPDINYYIQRVLSNLRFLIEQVFICIYIALELIILYSAYVRSYSYSYI